MDDERNGTKMQEAEIIRANLASYPAISCFLGDIIEQRLQLDSSDVGMLTAHLVVVDPAEWNKSDLDRLEKALELGKTYCIDFKQIFRGKRLSRKSKIADGQIIDVLAEVKAFEFLHSKCFVDITNVKREKDTKTVDFTAKRNDQNYAVEVTRLGLAQADRKKPKYVAKDRLPHHNIPGVRQPEGEFFIISGKENIPRIRESIFDAIENEYTQIREFCQTQGNHWNGMLIISTGRDYFVMNKYARTEFEITPNAVQDALKQVWNLLEKRREDYKYLNHIVIAMGKDLGKAIMCPTL